MTELARSPSDTAAEVTIARGTEFFARYAYAPNHLGYCGPPEVEVLRTGSEAEVRAVAKRFSGAWPYLRVLARMTGIADPLDRRIVESYWLGGGVGARLDPREFGAELLAVIGPQAGHYWAHLTPDLLAEAAGNHAFHVFGVYPWSRLLGRGMDEHPMHVLDSCRITWATVVSVDGAEAEVRCRRLELRGDALGLTAPALTRVQVRADGYAAVPDVAAGDEVAVHWGRICGRLDRSQVRDLETSTLRQLHLTSRRLRGGRG